MFVAMRNSVPRTAPRCNCFGVLGLGYSLPEYVARMATIGYTDGMTTTSTYPTMAHDFECELCGAPMAEDDAYDFGVDSDGASYDDRPICAACIEFAELARYGL